MKIRLVTAICLIVLAVGFSVFCLVFVSRTTQQLTHALEHAIEAALEQSPGWEEATEEVTRLWERSRSFLHVLFPHQNLNELEWSLGALPKYQRMGDAPLFIEHAVRGLQTVNTIREMERVTLGNIF
ncbi:MAG: DUF4363 family protein [Oscillospiraceae bacterium]|nr:DUF4363 family protein [Oscillospiraceae bacterium]